MTIGERIKFCRERAKLTQDELGKKVGVTGVAIMRYEKGTRQPRIEQIVTIATELGVSPLALMGDEVTADTVALVLGGSFEAANNYKKMGYAFTDVEFTLIKSFSNLNDEGQQKAVERVEELTEIPRYRRDEAPPPPTPDTPGMEKPTGDSESGE